MANKELCNEVKESLDKNIVSQKSTIDQQDSARFSKIHFNEFNNHINEPVTKTLENDVSIKNSCSKSPEVTG